ncbi:MAG TPA: PKD domain-containing protein, partial [Ferruginibacter sp.]|nr:PKD domain-containing protein [Ferruginibacter sp.]
MNKLLLYLLLLLSPSLWAQSNERLPVAIEVPGSGFQFINPQTNRPINQLFWDEAEPFVNGFSRVLSNGKFTFVNTQGQPIALLSFDEARNFEHKLAAVKTGGKWGFINESGKLIIPCRYDIVYDFKETVSPVYTGKKWSLLNSAGIVVKNLDISVCYGFDNGKARITAHGKTGIMNTNGDITFTGLEPVTETATRSNNPSTNDQVVTQCPENIDFEDGNFTNWRCFTGRVDSVGPTNVITVNPSAPINNRHTIIGRNMPSNIDPFGLFPINPPDGSNFAVKLGNTNIGAQAERIQYTITVPTNDSNFSIKYDYAVVFQDPGHTAWTQPRFIARLFDSAANSYIDCASFEYISTSNLPGFGRSTVDTSVIYKAWSTVFISLRGYAGKTLFLEFTNADCVRKGHWGYAYVDVEKTCSQNILIRYDCGNPSTATLQAPPGFMQYNWWNENYTTMLGSGQNIVLNPAPSINSIVWLEMIPFSDFGCRDSMPVRMTATFQPHFTSTATTALCAPHRFTFYNNDVPALSTTWDFGDGTTGTGDTVTHTFLLPGTYTVTMHVTLAGGCNGTTTNVITITQPTGSFNYTGGSFCNSRQVRFNAVTSNIDSLVWDFGDGTIITTTQTTVFHTYTNPGVYTPSLTIQSNAGCETTIPGTDPIRIEALQPGFTYQEQISCGSNTVNFTDTSHAYFGINDHDWNFGDGTTGTGINASHTYTSTGTYQVQLIITGTTGCKDTIIKPIFVRVYAIPSVSINGPATVCANSAVTLNSIIQSSDTVDMVQWTAPGQTNGNGSTYTINYANPGTYSIQLIIETNHGCRDTAVQSLTVRAIPDVVQPNDQFICNGTATDLVNFTGSVNNTSFSWTNNNTSIGLAASGNGNIPVFTASNNSNSDLTATITVTPDANGCPGTPVSFNITVYPTPSVMQPANQVVVCNRGTTTGINFTNFT